MALVAHGPSQSWTLWAHPRTSPMAAGPATASIERNKVIMRGSRAERHSEAVADENFMHSSLKPMLEKHTPHRLHTLARWSFRSQVIPVLVFQRFPHFPGSPACPPKGCLSKDLGAGFAHLPGSPASPAS